MQAFIHWLFRESASSVNWVKKDNFEWMGNFTIGDKGFEITFWKRTNFDAERGDWSAQFYRLGGSGRYDYDNEQIEFKDFIELFKIVDEALVELFSSVEVKQMVIEPQAVSDRRIEKCKQRREKCSPLKQLQKTAKRDFDQSKFFGYQTLFNYSKLKQMGYVIDSHQDVLLIKKAA